MRVCVCVWRCDAMEDRWQRPTRGPRAALTCDGASAGPLVPGFSAYLRPAPAQVAAAPGTSAHVGVKKIARRCQNMPPPTNTCRLRPFLSKGAVYPRIDHQLFIIHARRGHFLHPRATYNFLFSPPYTQLPLTLTLTPGWCTDTNPSDN